MNKEKTFEVSGFTCGIESHKDKEDGVCRDCNPRTGKTFWGIVDGKGQLLSLLFGDKHSATLTVRTAKRVDPKIIRKVVKLKITIEE